MKEVLPDLLPNSITNNSRVLAILSSIDTQGKLRGNHKNFIDIIQVGTQMGFTVYVLPIERLSLRKTLQRGFVYSPLNNKWESRLMPFPAIVYNRIPNRELERSETIRKKLHACINDHRISLFNPSFFNKWELFKWLKQTATCKKYLPRTVRLSNAKVLSKMLELHPYVYLKPESGKAGKGIMTVSYHPDTNLPYRLHIQKQASSTSYNSFNYQKLWSRISQEIEKLPYIVQQGIQLATYKDRKFDLRVLVQKNSSGVWEMTGLGARVAGSSSITTHVPRGGHIDEPLKLLTSAFSMVEAHTILENVAAATVSIASQIEKQSKHKLAEMSMDIGVDQQGQVWFFEANSKPMKFDEPHIRQKSLQRIFHYSLYLLNK